MNQTNPTKIVSTRVAEHYQWGGEQQNPSDGWYLLRSPGLHVIEEAMPPGAAESRHFHTHARQFFYVLEGHLTMEIEGQEFLLNPGEGIEIAPGSRHQAKNQSGMMLRFLLVSQPPSHGDRTESA